MTGRKGSGVYAHPDVLAVTGLHARPLRNRLEKTIVDHLCAQADQLVTAHAAAKPAPFDSPHPAASGVAGAMCAQVLDACSAS